ncbi:response regulator [Ruminiclostridium cellobioparum]|uniref:Stage 0 sporulation protein A homolog n=1 Tax=Ruminiclostridium cellobioparum subsp. termitidis CT1112 TaxID=1195236 RepID=S0FKQ2_RUMCE|nr:response regulator [Ruminiclostridium cellobioparum]EMS69103.1 response regulator receiver and SARP domain containing protein [Ruminiclostridium cellobioparum subsp. termitidis CT1112]
MLKTILVDDEELSIKRLNKILAECGEIQICNTFSNSLEAYEYIKENKIDVAFLDISMPDMDGMTFSGMLRDMDSDIDVVFITGYDEYAVKAFELNALDYLLKPVTSERLQKTLDKIKKKRRYVQKNPGLKVSFFNGFKICTAGDEGREIKLRSPKTEELFAFIVYKGTTNREEIVDTLWEGFDFDKALKNINSNIYYIRKALSVYGLEDCIKTGKKEIGIEKGRVACDLFEFERLIKESKKNSIKDAGINEKAIELYSGGFLNGKGYEWALEKARNLEKDYMELLEEAARYYAESEQPQKALAKLFKILETDSLREDVHYQIILLYMGLGKKNEARQQYLMLEKLLKEELGIRPKAKIRRLFQ